MPISEKKTTKRYKVKGNNWLGFQSEQRRTPFVHPCIEDSSLSSRETREPRTRWQSSAPQDLTNPELAEQWRGLATVISYRMSPSCTAGGTRGKQYAVPTVSCTRGDTRGKRYAVPTVFAFSRVICIVWDATLHALTVFRHTKRRVTMLVPQRDYRR